MPASRILTKQDVFAAYDILLGREPENESVVDRHLKKFKTAEELFRAMFEGPEIYRRHFRSISRYVFGKAPISSKNQIEVDCCVQELRALFDHIQAVWRDLGETQPHYSVLSVKTFSRESVEQNLDEFNRSGKAEVTAVMSQLAALGLNPRFDGTALELGCGVGRVTKFLANEFSRVFAYDVSSSHLELARKYMLQESINNAMLIQVNSPHKLAFEPHDLFYSRIVLQHNPPPIINKMLRAIFSKTNPGGIVVFQVPTAVENYRFNVQAYLSGCDKIVDMELHAIPQEAIFSAMLDHAIQPIYVSRDGSLTGFQNVSTTFVGVKHS